MGALTRSTMDWIDQMSNFHWLKSGISIDKYPVIGNGVLNYYLLKRTVQSLGGYDYVIESDSWPSVVAELGLATRADIDSSLKVKSLYQELVLPYEEYVKFSENSFLFDSQLDESTGIKKDPGTPPISECHPTFITPKPDSSSKHCLETTPSRPNKRPCESLLSPPPDRVLRPRKHNTVYLETTEFGDSDMKQRFEPWFGAPQTDQDKYTKVNTPLNRSDNEDEGEQEESDQDDTEEIPFCEICDEDAVNDLKCKRCENSYHYSCLGPRLCLISPYGSERWYCPKCLVGDGMFMFDEGAEYDLPHFQEMADTFREEYLETEFPIVDVDERNLVECLVEQQFWNHVNDTTCKLAVEYGADVRCDVKGSGFPTKTLDPYNRYSKHPWNLNNFPLNKMSLFHNMKETISGVTVPWAYVGMMFSAFCWHSEDHDTYSINYQHFGNTKTWYGIPQYAAAKFEAFSRSYVPELFEKQPDILFQRATMIPPETLIKEGIPCYAIDQHAGEFVLTFPHAYHSGFNHGFNYNEAVNYAPPDWVSMGKAAVFSYKQEKRSPVFSHDYLLIQTALNDRRNETAQWLDRELRDLIEREKHVLKQTFQYMPGIRVVQVKYDSSTDESYQCSECLCLSYISRIKLVNSKNIRQVKAIYCHDHLPKNIKKNQALIMESRFTIEDLEEICDDIQSLLGQNEEPLKESNVRAIEV